MAEKRPNVFQTKESFVPIKEAQVDSQPEKPDNSYENQKTQAVQQIYDYSDPNIIKTEGIDMSDALEKMRNRTEEQIRLRDEMLKKNLEQTNKYQQQFTAAETREIPKPESKIKKPENKATPKPIQNINMSKVDPYIQQLSQPQYNTPYDSIPLPSEGKLYKNKKPNIKISYLTTADENILTSQNLLRSGEFLEILFNRKMLENDLKYRDLLVGDRNAIMLWLRATSYGEMYPVTVFDEDDKPFDTEVDLSTLKTKKLGAEPDHEGLFSFELPASKDIIKFKLLTVGEAMDIETMVEEDKANEVPIDNQKTYTLEKQLVEVKGNRDFETIREYAQNMRIKDAVKLREYIEEIQCDVDLNIEIKTPRGGSIKTFLPLNLRFFWPELSI